MLFGNRQEGALFSDHKASSYILKHCMSLNHSTFFVTAALLLLAEFVHVEIMKSQRHVSGMSVFLEDLKNCRGDKV